MGEVAEARGKGDRADGLPTVAGISQQIAGVQQSLLSHESREGRALPLEQHMDVARGQPVVKRLIGGRDMMSCPVLDRTRERLHALTGAITAT